jgi:hypothetical protein
MTALARFQYHNRFVTALAKKALSERTSAPSSSHLRLSLDELLRWCDAVEDRLIAVHLPTSLPPNPQPKSIGIK